MDMKNHDNFQENLAGFVLGELNEQQSRPIQKHLDECAACRQEARRMQKVLDAADCLKAGQVDETTCRQARQALLATLQKLESEGGPPAGRWGSYPMIQYAAAAALLIGALLALHYLGPDQQLPETNGLTSRTSQDTPPAVSTTQNVQLQQVAQYFESGNVQGLADLLRSGLPETRQAAARRLAEIGDASVLDALNMLAGQWEGDPQDNPYQQAAEAIRKRLNED